MAAPLILPTTKHHTRFITCLVWFSICLFVTGLGIFAMTQKFQPKYLLVTAVTAFGVYYYGRFVWQYVSGEKMFVHLTTTSTDVFFSCKSESGQVQVEEQKVNMSNVRSMYILTYRRKLMKDRYIVFMGLNSDPVAEISPTPEIYNCGEEQFLQMVNYIRSAFPHVQIGA